MSTEFNSGVQMSLNGNLEVFPLEEVLRLLARSRKSGCLRVESSGTQGRIFLSNGTLSLATTANDVEMRNKLVASGLVEETAVRRIELSGSPVAESLAEGVSTTDWADFVREESVEGLYRIRKTGRGTFDFVVDLAPRYPTGQSFDSEVIMSESDRRALEWEDIETVLPRLDTVVRMVPALDSDDSVTLGPSTWQILAALGGGSSTAQVASRLMWSEFRTARETATLVRNGLVTVSEDEVPAAAPAVAQAPVLAPESTPAEETVEEEPTLETPVEEPFFEEIPEEDHETAEVEETPAEAEVEEPDVEVDEPAAEADEDAPVDEDAGVADEVFADEAAEIEAELPEEDVAESEPAAESFWGDHVEDADEPADVEDAEEVAHEDEDAEAAEASEPERTDEPSAPTWWRDEQKEEEPAAEEPASAWGSGRWNAEAPSEEAVIEATPWGSPVTDAVDSADDGEDESVAEVEDVVDDVDEPEPARSQGWWAETMGAAEEKHADADSEADRFLESVFSSLSGAEEETGEEEKPEDETGFGMGLLRRRRLGASARDVENDG